MTRHVVVTGANRGIGRAIAEAFVANGDTVSSIYRGGDLPEGVTGAIADISDTDAVNRAFDELEEQHGRVRVLIANAGITKDGLLMRMTDEDFEQVIDVNLTGTFRCVRRAVQSMMREKYGRIVLVGSVVGLLGNPGQVNYSSSKAALVGMARSITREVGARGITANVIAPGFIDTAMTAELPEDLVKQYQATMCSSAPMPRATSRAPCCRSTAASAWVTDEHYARPQHSSQEETWAFSRARTSS